MNTSVGQASTDSLALAGGTPLRRKAWPKWPQYGPSAPELIQQVLDGGRWAVSGTWTGQPALDQVFAQQFAEFNEVRYCVPTDHGSSALVMAMRALGVGPGDEVIVPGLTWVACASTVLRVNAVPVLVDVEPGTLCLSPEAVLAAVTPRTAAILVVHLYSTMANMDELVRIADRHGLFLIEDCAQVHGARWRGRRASSIGHIGTFSMQQGKVLTSGEGGAAVTSEPRLHSLLEQLRNDGRRYLSPAPKGGHMHLSEVGAVTGANLAMSEFQAALLIDGLGRLEEQNRTRAANAEYLTRQLGQIEGLEPVHPHPENDARVYYHYAVRYRPEAFAGRPVGVVCEALEAELGLWVHQAYKPLNEHALYRPHLDHPLRHDPETRRRLDPARFDLPEAARQHRRSILFHHPALLGTSEDMDDIAAAFRKVQRMAHTLPAA